MFVYALEKMLSKLKRSCQSEETEEPKKKRLCSYNEEWEKLHKWLTIGSSREYAKCKLCLNSFLVKWDGLKAINAHEMSEKHQSMARGASTSKMLESFFVKKNTAEEDKVIAAEVAYVFHHTQHHHSYLSMDCGIQLSRKCFPDSNIAAKLSCGRTKCEALVCNVLAPHSVEMLCEQLGNSFYSISSDASNRKYRKLFPLCVHYYTPEGMQSKVLDFYEDSNETSEAIADRIRGLLVKNGLDIKRITAYTADNAAVNYGKNKSVFQNLKKDIPNLIPAGCNCHIIHNTAKHAGKALGDMDVESLVIKVYNEFSISAKNVEKLKEFYDFVNLEWQNILRHVPTRWLSLYPAVLRLTEKWPAIKSYFLSLGEDECDPIIWKFVSSGSDSDATDDIPTSEEAYLYFYHNVLGIFHNRILLLEKSDCTSPLVYEIMENLLKELKQRLNDGFYGYKVSLCLKYLPPQKKGQVISKLNNFYERAILYLQKWFDFSENNPFHHLKTFSLTNDLKWDCLEDATSKLGLCSFVDMDALYSEYCIVKNILPEVFSKADTCIGKWNFLFSKAGVDSSPLPNLLSIVQYALSVPVSNAFTERVFSIMGNVWTDNRNRLEVDVVKSEIQCKINFNSMKCSEFYDYIVSKPLLIKAAKSNKKYTFKFVSQQD